MVKTYPSIMSLRAIEALERLGTVSAVANEIGLTQGAVSRQIQTLEDTVERKLVMREKQRLNLTFEGHAYVKNIRIALDHIETASLELTGDHTRGTLSLGILPSFGMRWLMPKLGQFSKLYPDVTLNMLTRLKPFDFTLDTLHASLHYGPKSSWIGVDFLDLLQEQLVAVRSQKHFHELHKNTKPQEILNYPIIHMATRQTAWKDWLNIKTGKSYELTGKKIIFDQFATVTHALEQGLGIALMPKYLISEDIARGKFIEICIGDPVYGHSYSLVWPKSRPISPQLRVFRDWLADLGTGEDALPR